MDVRTNESFFENLLSSPLGYLVVVITIIFIILLLVKNEWFFEFEERKPKLRYFDEYLLDDNLQLVFMWVRFVFIVILWFTVMKILINLI